MTQPELAKKITVDHVKGKLFVDGAEFPWFVGKETITVEADFISTVYVPVLCDSFESIGIPDE